MIPLFLPAQVRAFDERTIAAGTPSSTLMERAAGHVARAVLDVLPQAYGARVLALCGKGNNGGDGIAAARRLRERGVDARVHLVTGEEGLSDDAAAQLLRFRARGGRVVPTLSLDDVDVAIDCMLGTGTSGPAREPVPTIATELWHRKQQPRRFRVVACDLPSGIDADTGQVPGSAVSADVTVVIGAAKRGLWLAPARSLCGELRVVDIGLDASAESPAASVLEPADVRDALPQLRSGVDKRERGAVMLVAGSLGMAGAAIMAARGALGMGVGLLTIATHASIRDVIAPHVPEAMTLGLPADDPDAAYQLIVEHRATGIDAVGIGPGLGRDDATVTLVRRLVRDLGVPITLDADGLNAFRHDGDALAPRSGMRDLVVTPHAREYARLLGKRTEVDDVWPDRITNVEDAARRWGATVVLKGPGTIIAVPPDRTSINPTGSVALATGGTGDVLTGMLTAAQPLRTAWSVAATVFVHGLAGEIAAARATTASVTALDVAAAIPAALATLEAG